MNERPIWTAGMEAIRRSLTPEELCRFREEEIQRWTEEQMREAMWRYLRNDPWGRA